MSPVSLMKTMELVAYELAEAEAHERRAARHRSEAMSMQAAVYAEFKAALVEAEDLTPEQRLARRRVNGRNQTTVGIL